MIHTDIFASARAAYANRQEPERLRYLTRAYWRISLALTCIVVLSSIIWGILQLSDALSALGGAINTESTAPKPVLDRAALRSALSGFDARQATFDALKKGGATIPDPSK
ncbi:hypothetical protein HY968_02540 [Candidatus Kaiserbacteria bacterium]|nr:hypothetical protein [Candidatus Kaiserbacteria bacterium]